MGSYHGKWGFDACSHLKAVVHKYGTDPSLRFPPYSEGDLKIFGLLRKVGIDTGTLWTIGKVAAVVTVGAVAYSYGLIPGM